MAKLKDYYQVLGVPPRCHVRLIEEAYWDRAHHLQTIPTRKAQQRLSALNEAYETLGSPHKRMEYDRRYDRSQAGDSGNGNGAGFLNAVMSILSKPFRPD